ncbi:MAG: cupin domain-containing protein [Anaerolineales bacterium]
MGKKPEELLQDLVAAYHDLRGEEVAWVVAFDLQPEGGTWHVVLGGEKPPKVKEGHHAKARFIFVLSPETLTRLYTGDLSPLTAAGREQISEPAPLDFRLGEGLEMSPKVYRELITFIQRFFNVSSPERIHLGIEHARTIHGGHAVALFYDQGFRSAWYMLREGERLNAPGDTNPFPQAFIFLSGEGRAKIGEDTVRVQAGEAYYIPPQSEHLVWNEREEPLTLIFLAWGKEA